MMDYETRRLIAWVVLVPLFIFINVLALALFIDWQERRGGR